MVVNVCEDVKYRKPEKGKDAVQQLLPLKNLLRAECNYHIHNGKCTIAIYCWVNPYKFNDHVQPTTNDF